jgi:hypothetical protein
MPSNTRAVLYSHCPSTGQEEAEAGGVWVQRQREKGCIGTVVVTVPYTIHDGQKHIGG